MTVYRLMDGASGRPGVGSSGTQPPSSPTAYAGNFLAGTCFSVTSWGLWFQGYWWWVPTGGDTGAQKFALWELYNTATSVTTAGLIPAATVTSGTLTAGAFNYVPLATPVPLSAQVPYIAATGWVSVHGFPDTNSQFGSGQPYASGITNGPLQAYSDVGASNPSPSNWAAQGLFGTASSDPAASMPASGSNSANFWIDLQVTDTAPAGASYRLRPDVPVPLNMISDTATPFTLGTEFKLSQSCTYKTWFYSPSGATLLPAEIGIYSQGSQTLVSGTHNSSPSWSGAAGSGWVSCAGTVTLPAGTYRVAVCSGAASTVWNNAVNSFWGGGGPASSGIVNGPLSAPGESTADTPGQASYNAGSSLAWPGTYNAPGNGSDYLVDIEVTTAAVTGSAAPLIVTQAVQRAASW